MNNILAIDYGDKRIGLAWVQETLGVVLPFGVIENKEAALRNQEILELVEAENIDTVIVGLPLGLDGKENENTKKVRDFAAELEGVIGKSIEFVDERFSSHEADRMGDESVSRDERAAMVILQAYIDRQ